MPQKWRTLTLGKQNTSSTYSYWGLDLQRRTGNRPACVLAGTRTRTHTHTHTRRNASLDTLCMAYRKNGSTIREQVRIARCFYQVFICILTLKCLSSLLKLSGTRKAFCVSTLRRESKVKPTHCPLPALPYTSQCHPLSSLPPQSPVLKPHQRAWIGSKVKKGLG